MIKGIIKILLITFLILILAIFYLSIFGIKTNKFNNQINNSILKINKKINLNLNDVNYLLNPYNFTIKIKTKNPQILLEGRNLGIKDIQTNVALKSLINDQFLINDLRIVTKEIKLNDVIALVRIFQNSAQLYVLDTVIKDGFVTANMNLNFDESGRVKENYKITGSVKKVKLKILNKIKLQNLNFNFDIGKNIYLLKRINTKVNNIKIVSPLIEITKKKNSFFVNGQLLNDKKNFNIEELRPTFTNLSNVMNIRKIEFSSKNNFSFSFNESLKINNLKVESIIDLNKAIIGHKNLKLKPYFSTFMNEIKLEDHKIVINYNKNKFNIKGNGNIFLEDKLDSLSYQIIKDDINFVFDSKIKIKNNPLLIDFLDYEKKEGLNSLISIKGNFKKDNKLRFDFINLKEKNNKISIKGLDLNENFKIIDIKSFNFDYKNNRKILNKT